MNWRKSPRGDWAGHDGTHRYTISPIWTYEGRSRKPIRAWRMRIDGAQVGGADKTVIWMRVSDAKAYAEDLVRQNLDPFDIAFKAFPRCIVGGLDRPQTVSDLVYQAMHEIDMFEEGQDGVITARQAQTVRAFIQRFRTTEG